MGKKIMQKPSAIFCFLLLITATFFASAEPFSVGRLKASEGTLVSGFLDVPAGTDAGSKIPITVIHGATHGPVLALLAGIHGYEYPPITALQSMRTEIDPALLRGTVILVHVANLPSFLGRTIYYSPVDGKNLNRMFPGDPEGTLSQRIAHQITTEVIDQADYLIDLHAGDGNEALRPYVYMPVTGDAGFDQKIKGLAVAFGLDHIAIDTGPQHASGPSLFADQTALVRGIPAITTETGKSGSNDPHWSELAKSGVWNVLRHLRMVSGVEVPNLDITWLTDYQVVKSPASGIFQPATKEGSMVTKGALLGVLVDFFGNEITQVRAPFSGVINYVISTPPVNKDEPVAMMSKIQEQ
jgi:predicted deacylase